MYLPLEISTGRTSGTEREYIILPNPIGSYHEKKNTFQSTRASPPSPESSGMRTDRERRTLDLLYIVFYVYFILSIAHCLEITLTVIIPVLNVATRIFTYYILYFKIDYTFRARGLSPFLSFFRLNCLVFLLHSSGDCLSSAVIT